MDFIFFGMQGAGKGTVGKKVAEKFNLKVFETGAELRRLAQENSTLGKKVKEIIEAGHLVPNEAVMEIVENFMNTLKPGENILFDGIPRKIEQANSLNEVLKKHNRVYKAVILEITEETALKRLSTGKICSKTATTKVFFKKLTEHEINSYVRSGQSLDRAGAYDLSGLGSIFIKKTEGDYTNCVGLPVYLLIKELRNFGVDIF